MSAVAYALDAGSPWGLMIAPQTYLEREHLGSRWRPKTFETLAEADAERTKMYRTAPCYPNLLRVVDWV